MKKTPEPVTRTPAEEAALSREAKKMMADDQRRTVADGLEATAVRFEDIGATLRRRAQEIRDGRVFSFRNAREGDFARHTVSCMHDVMWGIANASAGLERALVAAAEFDIGAEHQEEETADAPR